MKKIQLMMNEFVNWLKNMKNEWRIISSGSSHIFRRISKWNGIRIGSLRWRRRRWWGYIIALFESRKTTNNKNWNVFENIRISIIVVAGWCDWRRDWFWRWNGKRRRRWRWKWSIWRRNWLWEWCWKWWRDKSWLTFFEVSDLIYLPH